MTRPREAGYPDNESRMPRLEGNQDRACYKHTCRIQKCLSESGYDSNACSKQIEALKRCCQLYGHKSIHCAFHSEGAGYGY